MPSLNSNLPNKAIVMAVLLLGLTIKSSAKDIDVDEVCAPLKGTNFYESCKSSQVVHNKGFIPKHLRPPWLNTTSLFKDNSLDQKMSMDNCYACYKGKKASNDIIEDEEYCACKFGAGAPDDAFGSVFGTINFKSDACLEDFYKVALMPKCGNENFDHIKHCAMVQFYKNMPKNEPENADAMRTLVLLDGCVTGSIKGCTANVKVEFKELGSSFFYGNCDETVSVAFESNITVKKASAESTKKSGKDGDEVIDDSSTFTAPILFQHRMCGGLFGGAGVENTFTDIKLTISGDCGEPKTYKLPDLDGSKGRVQEIRGLQLGMQAADAAQWRDSEGGYAYKKQADLKWQPTDLKYINTYGKSNATQY
ncbi:hypothetical protein GPALN_003371 [Globodera pallida]|nr:hypothetical protein GPALN_003371 [Globodera pallida]